MQLLIAVIQAEDADALCKRLNEAGFRNTRVNSTGGFLARGNVTILAGVQDEQVDAVINVIRAACRTRTTFVNAMPWGPEFGLASTTGAAMPFEVQVGGAAVFCLPVRRFLRLHGGPTPAVVDEQPALDEPPISPAEDQSTNQLLVAIVQNVDAAAVMKGLREAGHRFTRIDATGGFLRRGNATLVIGVEQDQVNAVLDVIQRNCQLRSEPKPAEAGLPMYSATVFVLDALQLYVTV